MSILKNCPVTIYGDTTFRGKCPTESFEQVSFFNWIRTAYPDSYGLLALHPRNEAKRKGSQFAALSKEKLEGMAVGAADIIIPARISFVCEMKRQDPTQSKFEKGQPEYLKAAQDAGAFVCVALGANAAREAFNAWLETLSPD